MFVARLGSAPIIDRRREGSTWLWSLVPVGLMGIAFNWGCGCGANRRALHKRGSFVCHPRRPNSTDRWVCHLAISPGRLKVRACSLGRTRWVSGTENAKVGPNDSSSRVLNTEEAPYASCKLYIHGAMTTGVCVPPYGRAQATVKTTPPEIQSRRRRRIARLQAPAPAHWTSALALWCVKPSDPPAAQWVTAASGVRPRQPCK